jgi:dihydroxyacid dehydratase/phosphogluconate dehydratase
LVLICGGERVEGEALACGLLTGLKTGHYMTGNSEQRTANSEQRTANSEKRKAKSEKRKAKSEKRVPRLRLPEAGKLGMTMERGAHFRKRALQRLRQRRDAVQYYAL